MKTTLNQALEIAQAGNWDKAWEVAQQDEGLSNDCTFEQWKVFAIKAIADRKEREELGVATAKAWAKAWANAG